jgi:hypothetical protein
MPSVWQPWNSATTVTRAASPVVRAIGSAISTGSN